MDLALILRRRKTGEWLLRAGGVWDRLACRYTGAAPKRVTFIDLEESQVSFTRWFASWLQSFKENRPRDCSLAIAGGDRRGGKTFDLFLCTIATCLEVPNVADGSPLIAWAVSCSYQERDELDAIVRQWIPDHWYAYRGAPLFRYSWITGAGLRNVSADDPETLKRGRVDIAFYNEAQKQSVTALSNGIYGTVDKGGIALLAANPPRRKLGEWVLHLKQAIDAKQVAGAKFFQFSSKFNTRVQQDARNRVGGILRLIDPRAAAADDEGAWLPVGDRAYPDYEPQRNLGAAPEVGDVTHTVTKRRAYRAFAFFGGADFQSRPHNAGVILRAFGDPAKPIYYAVNEILSQGLEDDFLDEVFDQKYQPETLVWIGDASGTWQDAEHSRGRVSFDVFKSRRWIIHPPQLKKSDRGEHPRNPDVDDRLNLVNALLKSKRLIIDPKRCPVLAEALKDCELGPNGKPRGRHAHVTDALGYALWWVEPKPKQHTQPPGRGDIREIDLASKGPRIL